MLLSEHLFSKWLINKINRIMFVFQHRASLLITCCFQGHFSFIALSKIYQYLQTRENLCNRPLLSLPYSLRSFYLQHGHVLAGVKVFACVSKDIDLMFFFWLFSKKRAGLQTSKCILHTYSLKKWPFSLKVDMNKSPIFFAKREIIRQS